MQLLCGQCGAIVTVPADRAGATVICPQCSRDIPVAPMHGEHSSQAQADEAGFAEQARNTRPIRLRVTCGSCGESFTVNGRLAGQRARCPKCSRPVAVPYPDDDIDIPVPARLEPLPRARVKPRRANALLAASALLAVALGAVAYYTIPLLLTPSTVIPAASDIPDSPTASRPAVVTTTAAPPLATSQPVAAPSSSSPVAAAGASCTVLAARADVFAAGGYHPARPGWIYLKITAKITAADKPLTLAAPGDDVTLTLVSSSFSSSSSSPFTSSPSSRLKSLGLAADGEALARSLPSTRRIEAGCSQTLTFLFETPADSRRGRLAIRGAGDAPLPQIDVPAIAEAAIVGQFVEKPPRNLKPLLRDPVMAAIQAAGKLRISIRNSRTGSLLVSLEPPAMRAVAKAAGNGVYDVTFSRDGNELKCKLRLADGGQTLILYLADGPFHQITYTRTR